MKRYGYQVVILRDIKELLENDALSPEFRVSNFGRTSYISEQNKKMPCYGLTRDGFTMLVMGHTGDKAMRFKEWCITRFNKKRRYF